MRSSLHPRLFAVVYRITAHLAALCGLTLPNRAKLLLAVPKVTQAVFAALLDCYTWKLAEKAYGKRSRTALVTVGEYPAISLQYLVSYFASLARPIGLQPVAMVLLNPNIVQLFRDNAHFHRALLLAMALAGSCEKSKYWEQG